MKPKLFSHSVVFNSATPWTAACQASLSFTISWSLLKLLSIELVMPSNHLTLCRPLLLLPSIFSSIWVFSNRLFPSGGQSISPSSENSGLISFSIYWFKLFAVQGTLKNLLQHHSSKASVLQWSGFFMVQLLHPYITTGKTITLTRWTFVSKIMSLLFNTLSRFVMAFLPMSKCLEFHGHSHHLQWFWSPKNKVYHCFDYLPIYLKWSYETRCHVLKFSQCWILSQCFHSLLSL